MTLVYSFFHKDVGIRRSAADPEPIEPAHTVLPVAASDWNLVRKKLVIGGEDYQFLSISIGVVQMMPLIGRFNVCFRLNIDPDYWPEEGLRAFCQGNTSAKYRQSWDTVNAEIDGIDYTFKAQNTLVPHRMQFTVSTSLSYQISVYQPNTLPIADLVLLHMRALQSFTAIDMPMLYARGAAGLIRESIGEPQNIKTHVGFQWMDIAEFCRWAAKGGLNAVDGNIESEQPAARNVVTDQRGEEVNGVFLPNFSDWKGSLLK